LEGCNTDTFDHVCKGSTHTEITNADIFATESRVNAGNRIYIIERHFLGGREVAEAIGTVVQNAAKQENITDKTA
jgi:hypothetical protein